MKYPSRHRQQHSAAAFLVSTNNVLLRQKRKYLRCERYRDVCVRAQSGCVAYLAWWSDGKSNFASRMQLEGFAVKELVPRRKQARWLLSTHCIFTPASQVGPFEILSQYRGVRKPLAWRGRIINSCVKFKFYWAAASSWDPFPFWEVRNNLHRFRSNFHSWGYRAHVAQWTPRYGAFRNLIQLSNTQSKSLYAHVFQVLKVARGLKRNYLS